MFRCRKRIREKVFDKRENKRNDLCSFDKQQASHGMLRKLSLQIDTSNKMAFGMFTIMKLGFCFSSSLLLNSFCFPHFLIEQHPSPLHVLSFHFFHAVILSVQIYIRGSEGLWLRVKVKLKFDYTQWTYPLVRSIATIKFTIASPFCWNADIVRTLELLNWVALIFRTMDLIAAISTVIITIATPFFHYTSAIAARKFSGSTCLICLCFLMLLLFCFHFLEEKKNNIC